MRKNKGFVVSAVLYPLLVLFLALVMGVISMTDTRKRILDRMKLQIGEEIFDSSTCSCDTLLNKLNYIINTGVKCTNCSGGVPGGDTGSYAYNKLTLNVKTYESLSDFPVVGNIIGDIAVLSDTPIKNYYVSTVTPKSPQEGTVWIVQDHNSEYFITSDWNRIGVSYVMQYEGGKWVIKKSYVYTGEAWTLLYWVPVSNGDLNLTATDINAKTTFNYSYTGKTQVFHAPFAGTYEIELWGASGGYYGSGQAAYPGKGAYTKGTIYLDAGTSLYIYVGGQGGSGYNDSDVDASLAYGAKKSSGGWNGGGFGTFYNTSYWGNGGGGATDVRLVQTSAPTTWNEFDSLKSRIMVAGGGGGASYNGSNYTYGGAGGTLSGIHGHMTNSTDTYFQAQNGGTQGHGGDRVYHYTDPKNTSEAGGFGYGGHGAFYHYSGGGGGYFGGGGGGNNALDGIIAGGGGSSYISGYVGCDSISADSTKTNIVMTGSAYHYPMAVPDGNNSKVNRYYYFTNGSMQAGNNLGNGKAKITLKSIEVRSPETMLKNQQAAENRWDFTYSGNYQEFTAPVSGTYKMQLYGASGGVYHSTWDTTDPGRGALTEGNIYLKAGTKFYVYVGGRGSTGYASDTGWAGYSTYYSKGGYNGGGNGTFYNTSYWGNGGGGATDVRTSKGSATGFDSLKTRIMVAAGGGGANHINGTRNKGGNGGGLKGVSGHLTDPAITFFNAQNFATQSSGGEPVFRADDAKNTGTSGTFGQGGDGAYYHSSGGGGGYYGGGGGGHNYSDGHITGGGGSSYISGHAGCNSISEDSTLSKITMTGASYHYSGLYYTNTKMTDGVQLGDGKAIFTLIDRTTQDDNLMENKKFDYNKTWTFDYSGNYQTFTAPVSGDYKIQLYGASGGVHHYTWVSDEGKGAYTDGTIYLDAGTTLYVYVGGKGGDMYFDASGWTGYSTYYSKGGWNGGGNGTYHDTSYWGNGGGGATDIRLVSGSPSSFDSLKSRIMVAGGGGGAGYIYNTRHIAGAGGALNGDNGHVTNTSINYYTVNNGATQTLPGKGVKYYMGFNEPNSGKDGSFGQGGDGAYHHSPGGGGGYYGGGGGGHNYNDDWITAGGGSSYISGYEGCNSITKDSTVDKIEHTGSAYHYSGYYFTSASMRGSVQEGNGKAIITLLSKKTVSADVVIDNQKNNDKVWYYYYLGKPQTFTAPKTGTYEIDLYGASGGANHYSLAAYEGKGAETKGRIYLKAGESLYVYVGGKGADGYYSATLNGASPTNYISEGGYNGGGNGSYGSTSNWGNGGGGATDVRLSSGAADNFNSLKSRIMVAAGGAGAEYNGAHSYGGNGGGLVGSSGRYSNNTTIFLNASTGGSQTLGGFATIHGLSNPNHTGQNGSFGKGGNGSFYYSSGGGGGYYGGGGGGHNNSDNYISGAGGSSYISGYAGCNSIKESSTTSNIIHTGSAYHYSGKYFTNSSMTTNVNTGNGKAIIKLVDTTEKTDSVVSSYQVNNEKEWNYTFNGNYQEFKAPVNGTYSVTLNGAEGGYHYYSYEQYAGDGAKTTGDIYLKAGTTLYVYVGGHGGYGYNDKAVAADVAYGKYVSSGGYNGGGNGSYGSTSNWGNGGGGATDIRLVSGSVNDFNSLKSRIMVAAGGAGTEYNGAHSYGGAGGGLTGLPGRYSSSTDVYINGATGATQSGGGFATFRVDAPNHIGQNGSFGKGGNGSFYYSSGGGGGYFGGGGGGHNYSDNYISASGGSSYISGYEGCNSITEASTATKVTVTGDEYHYSGYYFTNGIMTQASNKGNGSAKIVLTKKDDTEPTKASQTEWTYDYSGNYQVFTAPQTGYYLMELWGASGGYYHHTQSSYAGLGSYTAGRIQLTKGTTLYIYVGGKGGNMYFDGTGWTGYSTYYSKGGWNGGGDGTYYDTGHWGNGGGGATDIRTVATNSLTSWNEAASLNSRIMVAAGGSGVEYDGGGYQYGAAGGGLTGYNGRYRNNITDYTNNSVGGSQSSGGKGTYRAASPTNYTGYNGGFGFGGTGAYYHSSGGGSGWYGGGGGGYSDSVGWLSGASGSCYISGHNGCIAVNSSGSPLKTTATSKADSNSWTNFVFTNTTMIDGRGYTWTNIVSSSVTGMPKYNGTGTMTGNLGNGYARITFVGA